MTFLFSFLYGKETVCLTRIKRGPGIRRDLKPGVFPTTKLLGLATGFSRAKCCSFFCSVECLERIRVSKIFHFPRVVSFFYRLLFSFSLLFSSRRSEDEKEEKKKKEQEQEKAKRPRGERTEKRKKERERKREKERKREREREREREKREKREKRENPCFFWWVSLCSTRKQGIEDQGSQLVTIVVRMLTVHL